MSLKAQSVILKSFQDLDKEELYKFLQLRIEVFVVEQNCPYQDCDHKDKLSFHLLGYYNGVLVAYLRIVDPGISFKEVSIGRVVTKAKYRGQGLGKVLMLKAIESVIRLYDSHAIRISAQQYLTPFYESLNFITVGEGYLEDDIPHIEMIHKD